MFCSRKNSADVQPVSCLSVIISCVVIILGLIWRKINLRRRRRRRSGARPATRPAARPKVRARAPGRRRRGRSAVLRPRCRREPKGLLLYGVEFYPPFILRSQENTAPPPFNCLTPCSAKYRRPSVFRARLPSNFILPSLYCSCELL
jgi:hypothetical protein